MSIWGRTQWWTVEENLDNFFSCPCLACGHHSVFYWFWCTAVEVFLCNPWYCMESSLPWSIWSWYSRSLMLSGTCEILVCFFLQYVYYDDHSHSRNCDLTISLQECIGRRWSLFCGKIIGWSGGIPCIRNRTFRVVSRFICTNKLVTIAIL